jgi:hypothetical protein
MNGKKPLLLSLLGVTTIALAAGAYFYFKQPSTPQQAPPLYLSVTYTIEQRKNDYKLPVSIPSILSRLNIKPEEYAAYLQSSPALNKPLYIYLTPANFLSLSTTPSALTSIVNTSSQSDTKLLHQLLPSVVNKLVNSKANILATLKKQPTPVTTQAKREERVKRRTTPAPTPALIVLEPKQLEVFNKQNEKELIYLKSLNLVVNPNDLPQPASIDTYVFKLLSSYTETPK